MRHAIRPAEDLFKHRCWGAGKYSGWAGTIVGRILVEGQSDPSILHKFCEWFHYVCSAVVREVTNRLQQTFKLSPGINGEVLMDMLYSSIYKRLMWQPAQIDQEFIRDFPIRCVRLIGVEFDDDGHVIE